MLKDDLFYIQDAKADLCYSDNNNNVILNGTEKHPVKIMGEIDSLDVDILGPSLSPVDEITLKLIMSQLHPYGLPAVGKLYYMQFLFYTFDRAVHLYLLSAKIIEINRIPTISHKTRRYGLKIISTKRDGRAAYEAYETKHGVEWKSGD